MACGFDKGLIAAVYDGEATAPERDEAERHLASCPECARDLASMKELSSALKPLKRAPAPLSIAEGVMRQIGPTRAAVRPWVRWGMSAAAALLLAVGTVFMINRGGPAGEAPVVALAPEKQRAAKTIPARPDDAAQAMERAKQQDESKNRLVDAPPAPTPPTEPAPAPLEEPKAKSDADEARAQDPRRKEADLEEAAKPPSALGKDSKDKEAEKPSVPVIRVRAASVAAARAEVELFLKERELAVAPGAPLLGKSAFVRDHYLQVDLTEEEVRLLEKRLAAQKGTTLARGTLEAEQKRVAEQLAKSRDQAQDFVAPKAADADPKAPPPGGPGAGAAAEGKTERARGGAGGEKKVVRSARIILVFEPAPPPK